MRQAARVASIFNNTSQPQPLLPKPQNPKNNDPLTSQNTDKQIQFKITSFYHLPS